MKCEYCELVERSSKAQVLYEDNEIMVVVKDMIFTPGQVTIFPKSHFTILEMVPDAILQKCFTIANKVGMAVFDGLGSQGTNILVQNGLSAGQKVPHFAVEVIPRREEDNLNLRWDPQQVPEEEMDRTHQMLTEVVMGEDVVIPKEEKTTVVNKIGGKDNYLLKSLKRIP